MNINPNWTEGCQYERGRLAARGLGAEHLATMLSTTAEDADSGSDDTCVVRQSPHEDKPTRRLSSLNKIKKHHPDMVINLMGCLVGVKGNKKVAERFPYCRCLLGALRPVAGWIDYLLKRDGRDDGSCRAGAALRLPGRGVDATGEQRGNCVSAFIPVVVRLLACLTPLLHHPLPPRGGSQPPPEEILAEVAPQLCCPGCQRNITLLSLVKSSTATVRTALIFPI